MHVERISTCVFARVSNSSIRFEVLPHVIGFNFATKMILQCMFCKEIVQCVLYINIYIYHKYIYIARASTHVLIDFVCKILFVAKLKPIT